MPEGTMTGTEFCQNDTNLQDAAEVETDWISQKQFFRSEFTQPDQLKEDFKTVFIGAILWSIFYIVIKMAPLKGLKIEGKLPTREQDADLRNRMVSFVHGFIAMVLSGYHVFTHYSECGALNTNF